jgi:hypothetical protein
VKESISAKVDRKVEEFIDMDPTKKDFNPGLFDYTMKQAVVGLRFKQAEMVADGIAKGQIIRIIMAVSEDKEQREAWIRQSMPKILPMNVEKAG